MDKVLLKKALDCTKYLTAYESISNNDQKIEFLMFSSLKLFAFCKNGV
jgi:hypothetical protein